MTHLQFKGIVNIGRPSISEVIRDNLISYLDWAFLETGAFYNIEIPTSGAYGSNRARLRPVSDPRYTDGQVWEGYRGNWLWESGLSTSSQPIKISGVFVGTTYYPHASGDFVVNYPDGRIIFNTAIATNSVVKLAYSHRWINVLSAKNLPWFQTGHLNSFRVDDANYLPGSGEWTSLSETRVELPAIAVETLASRSYQGYQLGQGSWVYTDVLFHVLTEDETMACRLTDTLANQWEKTIFLFDTNRMANQDRFPLKHDGSKSANPLTYPDLVKTTGEGGFRYTADVDQGKLRISEVTAQSNPRLSHRLYHSTVRWKTEVIMPRI